MSRCYICDWSPTGEQSDYNSLCHLDDDFHLEKNFICYDDGESVSKNGPGKPICFNCLCAAENINEDLEEEEDEFE